ncbi:asparaginase domain-containing protein [Salinispira pacifica]|uniref:Asparaginase n=1 Tax=Salinispira pacifica TaxID=1307761 RepID=V5WH42_9SPIO|nr:asparaginase domain-containing protein [Salinispira pacifica]AHC15103.1 asparaginase [Salinispira pacifica]
MKPVEIRIIITGGTFDKEYDPLKGELSFRDSHLPGILKTVRCTLETSLEINELTDSLDMTDVHREGIAKSCLASPQKRIVITHGTDTMTLTAEYLQKRFQEEGVSRTVVFTGAMVPYSVNGSDALFNLGAAVSAAQLLDEGIYICMNGRVFQAGKVMKDRGKGIFTDAETDG